MLPSRLDGEHPTKSAPLAAVKKQKSSIYPITVEATTRVGYVPYHSTEISALKNSPQVLSFTAAAHSAPQFRGR